MGDFSREAYRNHRKENPDLYPPVPVSRLRRLIRKLLAWAARALKR